MANLFGTLNRFIARLDSDPNTTSTQGGNTTQKPQSTLNNNNSNNNHYGFQVLRSTNLSIALEPWFDYIIGINGHNIDNPDPNLFITEVRNCAGTTISLGVYGAKGGQIREVYIAVPPADESLGLALQWSPLSAAEEVWHILDVMPNSPADVAGLLPYSDYVLASPDGALYGDAGLGQLVEGFMDRPLRLFVYNQEYDVTRLVTITPARNWGGEGSLGCVLGYGALHRIPAPLAEPSQGPGETLFEVGREDAYLPADAVETTGDAEFLVPANMHFGGNGPTSPAVSGVPSPSAAPPPPSARARKARAHHTAPAAGGLDDYFAEGEAKSRAMDNSPAPKNADGLPPPPPKGGVGGPPKATSPAIPPANTGDEEAEDA